MIENPFGNPYLRNLKKIGFVLTYACTGRCRHCSEGDHKAQGIYLDAETAARAAARTMSKVKKRLGFIDLR